MPLPNRPAHGNQRKFESPALYPLPALAETRRSPHYLVAMRWMVYAPLPLEERTADHAAARFGLDGGVTGAHGFRAACAADGITDWQLLQQGWLASRDEVRDAAGVSPSIRPPAGLMPPPTAPPQPMGSPAAAEREREQREQQVGMLERERERIAAILTASDAGTSAHTKALTSLKMVNGMLEAATGLGLVMQAARVRVGRVEALPQSPPDEGRLIDVGSA